MTNEDHNAEWELGDAITVSFDPEEPEPDPAAAGAGASADPDDAG